MDSDYQVFEAIL